MNVNPSSQFPEHPIPARVRHGMQTVVADTNDTINMPSVPSDAREGKAL